MRFAPRSLLGQLAVLVLGAFIATQVLSTVFFSDARGAAIRAVQRAEAVERTRAVAAAIQMAPDTSRDSILAAASSRLVRFSFAEMPLVDPDRSAQSSMTDLRTQEVTVSPHDGEMVVPPAALSWMHDRMRVAGVAPVEYRISVPVQDGGWLNVEARFQRPDMHAPPMIMGATVLSLVLILAALWLGLQRITTPLVDLARAADRVDLDGPFPDMPRRGPREVQALAHALARMNTRLTGMIADRTRMLAALGHDLRSPITALRVRAEMVDEDETRERMISTLDEMQEMVETTLAFARGVSTDQPMEDVDLPALLRDLANELSESGPAVRVAAAQPLLAQVRRVPMRRALRNIIENAQRYGGGTCVSIHHGTGGAEIQIDDQGRGIPEQDIERVFDPFTRLETSRSRETGGIGLGLPIARAILRAHGGDVRLQNRPEGGLRATVTVPLQQG